jgi:hypothetical protein
MTKALQNEGFFSKGEHFSNFNQEAQVNYSEEKMRYNQQYRDRLLNLRLNQMDP